MVHIQDAKQHEKILEAKKSTIKIWKDKAGRYQGEKESAEAEMDNLKAHYEKEIEGVKNDLGIARRKIASYTNIQTSTNGSVQLIHDTVWKYRDRWSSFRIDSNQLSYSSKDSITLVPYYKRPGWFKSKKLYIRAVSYNPNTSIVGLDHFRVVNKPTRFALSLQVGFGLSSTGFSPYIGLGIGGDIWRF